MKHHLTFRSEGSVKRLCELVFVMATDDEQVPGKGASLETTSTSPESISHSVALRRPRRKNAGRNMGSLLNELAAKEGMYWLSNNREKERGNQTFSSFLKSLEEESDSRFDDLERADGYLRDWSDDEHEEFEQHPNLGRAKKFEVLTRKAIQLLDVDATVESGSSASSMKFLSDAEKFSKLREKLRLRKLERIVSQSSKSGREEEKRSSCRNMPFRKISEEKSRRILERLQSKLSREEQKIRIAQLKARMRPSIRFCSMSLRLIPETAVVEPVRETVRGGKGKHDVIVKEEPLDEDKADVDESSSTQGSAEPDNRAMNDNFQQVQTVVISDIAQPKCEKESSVKEEISESETAAAKRAFSLVNGANETHLNVIKSEHGENPTEISVTGVCRAGASSVSENSEESCERLVNLNVLTFPDDESFRRVFPAKQAQRIRSLCPITLLPARYVDPLTKASQSILKDPADRLHIPYYDAEAFKVIRSIYSGKHADVLSASRVASKKKRLIRKRRQRYSEVTEKITGE
ncbi:unnamed protein product [Notodromas monacha]|uniref:Vps72/YL1 C-terminal domain-containing protein n=1 Tax=Notodromas monacha TaxID=399045 RepID=A0A7R9BEY4_9CRUS|nr:unnamed protein product [Notodromas monacha]CAG0914125.1 unnamed protein product [Notodromas monacha]